MKWMYALTSMLVSAHNHALTHFRRPHTAPSSSASLALSPCHSQAVMPLQIHVHLMSFTPLSACVAAYFCASWLQVRLPNVMEQFLQNATLVLITLGVIAAIFPWFLLALLPISVFFFYIIRYFRPTQRQIKRLDNTSRSPLFSHISSTLGGIVSSARTPPAS